MSAESFRNSVVQKGFESVTFLWLRHFSFWSSGDKMASYYFFLFFQLFVSIYLLYLTVGVSFLAGLIFSILLIPVNKFIANRIGTLSTKMMKSKDKRVQLMTEILRGIRTVKFHVWESHFIKSILSKLFKLFKKQGMPLKGRFHRGWGASQVHRRYSDK